MNISTFTQKYWDVLRVKKYTNLHPEDIHQPQIYITFNTNILYFYIHLYFSHALGHIA